MFPIDFRTVYFCFVIISMVNLVLIGSLYVQIKKRFPGTIMILLSFIMITTGNTLLFLRSYIPDWISISMANLLIVSSTVTLLIGFERFVNRKGVQIHNYILIFIFLSVHTYFAFIDPNMNARNLNFSVVDIIFSSQIALLLLTRTPLVMRKITRPLGVLFCVICAIEFINILFIWQRDSSRNYFNSETTEIFYLLAWTIISILLAYSITLMYNKRLILDINIQEEKFSKAFHAAPFIIMLSKHETGEIFEVNKSIQAISGYQPVDLINNKTTDLHLWNQNNDRKKFISHLNTEGKVTDNEYLFHKKSGELFTGLISANTIVINNEQCIISVISDISERKRAENKLLESELSLRELNSTKDKFFSIIAHDLKSPFSGIQGFSELLIEKIRSKDYLGIDRYAEIIHKSSVRASDLLTNLMHWSMLQTGRMEFNPEYIETSELIRSANELLIISADQKSIEMTLNTPKNLTVYGDKFMLETVMRNLISNAIKFTPKNGKVHISVEDKEREVLFVVKDSGIGIEKKNCIKLFRIDEDFSSLGTEKETGTGLGLILCNDFIQKHKGKIGVESELGIGSQFYFTIPKV